MKTIIAAAIFLSQVAVASAATIVSTFGPSDSYRENGGGLVGYASETLYERAYSFTVHSSASYFLDGIEVAVGSALLQSSTITFNLKDDSAGLPGSTLDSFQFSPGVTTVFEGEIVSGQSNAHPILLAGHTYWLHASVPSELPYMYWKIAANDSAVTWAIRRDSGPWQLVTAEEGDDPSGAFRISGTVVPEASSALLLCGMIVVLANRRSR